MGEESPYKKEVGTTAQIDQHLKHIREMYKKDLLNLFLK